MSLYGELVARRRVWERREPELCEKPTPGGRAPVVAEPRPTPVPRGPIETYADGAWFASLAGFGAALAATRRMDRAVAALYAGLPKGARLGREAFAAQLGRPLADRGVLRVRPGEEVWPDGTAPRGQLRGRRSAAFTRSGRRDGRG